MSFSGCGPQSNPKGPAPSVQQASTLLDKLISRYPAPNEAACLDAQLRFLFSEPVSLGSAGKIKVFRASNPSSEIAIIDLAGTDYSGQVGDRPFHMVRPVFIDRHEAVVYLPRQALAANQTYFVTVDEGVFLNQRQASLGKISDPSAFRFATRSQRPAMRETLTIASDGSGEFCSVQGAVDFLPTANATPVTLSLKNGIYHEIVLISGKHQVTLRGEERKKTVLRYPNNDVLQEKLGAKFRAMVSVEDSHGFVLENLTLENSTPQGGSQAEALRLEGTDRAILRNADFSSRQDTLLLSGRVFVADSTIEGNVDFIWGRGTAYFENCEVRTVARSGYIVQSRNAANQHGYVFVDCKITAEEGLTGILLARIDAHEYPASNVAYVNCKMGPQIAPKGWLVTPAGTTATQALRFWEYESTDLHGAALDVSQRDPASRQLTAAEAAALRDKGKVFGGWVPGPRRSELSAAGR